MNDKIVL